MDITVFSEILNLKLFKTFRTFKTKTTFEIKIPPPHKIARHGKEKFSSLWTKKTAVSVKYNSVTNTKEEAKDDELSRNIS